MSKAETLLIELGVEELPAGPLQAMSRFFGEQLHAALNQAGFGTGAYRLYATPRRLAVAIDAVAAEQPSRSVQKRGPALQAAFDQQGKPTKALAGFARSCGVEIDQLTRLQTDKGEWMAYESVEHGQSLATVLSELLVQLFKQMPMPKRMRWADQSHEFLRPVQWLLVLHGSNVLALELFGLQSDRKTYGHRFHAPDPLNIEHADHYQKRLMESGYVIADFVVRRDRVQQQVLALAQNSGAKAHIEAELLDEVTALVEWPVAIEGSFASEFLRIPKEALIQTMEENQRYFALLDEQDNLLPGFIAVANLESSQPDTVREGNERVIRPRFQDTMFFWDNDIKKPLSDHREGLKKVLFQEKLGSVHAKSERLQKLCTYIASKTGADQSQCATAAQLAKCDLLTDLVGELAKMQGIAGRYYAQLENYPESVCAALEQQYWPKQAGGELPTGAVACALSIADKADTLVGIFGIGLKPSGAKDPFGLRRASLGLLRILIENEVDLDLRELIEQATLGFDIDLQQGFQSELLAYILERLRGYYQEKGQSSDVVDAVLSKHVSNPLDIDRRVRAVSAFRQTEPAASLAAANKRIRNILKKNPIKETVGIDSALFEGAAELALEKKLNEIAHEIEPHFANFEYTAAMTATAKLREPVDQFFDDVMVMVEDASIRANRLALLREVGDLCSRTADLSRLQIESAV